MLVDRVVIVWRGGVSQGNSQSAPSNEVSINDGLLKVSGRWGEGEEGKWVVRGNEKEKHPGRFSLASPVCPWGGG